MQTQKGHHSSSVQCGLKNLCSNHRGPPYTCMCVHHLKIMQEVQGPLSLDLWAASHKPHVFSHSQGWTSKHPVLPNSFKVGENMYGWPRCTDGTKCKNIRALLRKTHSQRRIRSQLLTGNGAILHVFRPRYRFHCLKDYFVLSFHESSVTSRSTWLLSNNSRL